MRLILDYTSVRTARRLGKIKINQVRGLGADLVCSVQLAKNRQIRTKCRKDVTGRTPMKRLRLRTDFKSRFFR